LNTALDPILSQAEKLAEARQHLAAFTGHMQHALDKLRTSMLPDLRTRIDAATTEWTALETLIRENPHLFVKPRTVRAHGLAFGIEKDKGAIEIADPDKTVKLIKKHLPEQAELLIVSKEVPVKKALAQLPGADLKRIGVTVINATDRVVIRAGDNDVDKLVKALIKTGAEEAQEQGEAEARAEG
jgi:hypothetical protein